MAQPQTNIDIIAPGQFGLNLEDSPVGLGPEWAARAEHAILDQEGRLGSRKGIQLNDVPNVLVETMKEFVSDGGEAALFTGGANNIYKNGVVMVLPVGYTITANNWQMIQFNNRMYFVQEGHPPLEYDPDISLTDLAEVDTTGTPIGVTTPPRCGTAGEGHMWYGGFAGARQVVMWSSLLDGDNLTGGDSGQLDLSEHWPAGFDEVVGLIVHNEALYIFGEHSILVYSGATDPTYNLRLVETVNGIGCAARDSIVPIGRDVYFMDYNGVRSLGRTIQEKSVPIADVSRNIQRVMERLIEAEFDLSIIRAEYSPENFMYAIVFPTEQTMLIFDTREPAPTGGARATSWPDLLNVDIRCMERRKNQDFVLGGKEGVYLYTGTVDILAGEVTNAIKFLFRTHPQTYGSHVNLKFPKQVDVALFGGAGQCLRLRWSFEYDEPTSTMYELTECFPQITVAEYGIAEYGIAEYTGYNTSTKETKYNVWGQGRRITYQLSMDVSLEPVSLQELNMQALTGRIL